jgi:hypothetical protein
LLIKCDGTKIIEIGHFRQFLDSTFGELQHPDRIVLFGNDLQRRFPSLFIFRIDVDDTFQLIQCLVASFLIVKEHGIIEMRHFFQWIHVDQQLEQTFGFVYFLIVGQQLIHILSQNIHFGIGRQFWIFQS